MELDIVFLEMFPLAAMDKAFKKIQWPLEGKPNSNPKGHYLGLEALQIYFKYLAVLLGNKSITALIFAVI